MVKKLILLGFALALLVGLPLAIFVVQQNNSVTNTKSSAAQSTKFTFDTSGLPTTINVGDSFNLPIDVDPQGQNQVSFVKVTFTFDGNFLSASSNNVSISNAKSGSTYTTLEGPTITCNDANVCQGTFTISIGSNTQDVISTKTKVASIQFTAKANTDPQNPTTINFVSGQNQALSVASTDQPAENVFQGGVAASVTIGTQGNSGGDNTTPTPSGTDNGGSGSNGGSGTGTGGSGGSSGNGGSNGNGSGGTSSVSCSSLTASPQSGASPLSVTFTTVGTSSNDSISNLAINYGDGNIDQIASGSGIGTGNVNAQTTHDYAQDGTYTATATFTTASGATSASTECSQQVAVGTTAGSNNGITPTGSPLENMKTGPGDTLLEIGIGGAILTLVGIGVMIGL